MEDDEVVCINTSDESRELDGIIERIVLKNFFCHDHLDIDFNKRINFIIGRNGSGKSAILTALVVGLGARASVTNRGSNLQSFIKKGANSASIEIKIKNNSLTAYKHEVYGDSITIIRTINPSGSNYKIKNTSGEVISTKHDEVTAICSVLNIQVDNPICVLNQDDARNFHAADSKLKYNFFRKATNMDMIMQNYKTGLNNCITSKEILDRKKQALSVLEKEVDTLQLQYEQLQSKDAIENRLKDVENEFFWTEIAECEVLLKKFENEQLEHEKKIEKINKKKKHFNGNYDKQKAEIEETKAKIADLQLENKELSENLSEKHKEIQETKKAWKLGMYNVQKKKDQIMKLNTNINDLTKEIATAMAMNTANEEENMAAKKEVLTTKLQEAIARKDTISHEFDQMRNALSHYQSQYENLITTQNRLMGKQNQLKSLLNELNTRGQDNLAVYGSNMVDLVRAVKEANNRGEFSAMPVGPIGFHLKVRNKKWTSSLEHIIGGSITTFCVNNHSDSRKLQSIMNKIYGNDYRKPTVWTSKFLNRVHNVSTTAVHEPPGSISVFNCLDIENSTVANFVIDSMKAEGILLVSTQDEAMALASDINMVPKNCIKIVTEDSQEYYPAPNYRSYGGISRPSKFLQINTSDRKKQLQVEITTSESELGKVRRELNEVNASRNETRKQETELDTRLRQLIGGIQTIKSNLSKIEANLRNMESEHIGVLNEELQLAKAKISELREEEATLIKEESVLRQAVNDAESVVEVARRTKMSSENAISNLSSEVREKSLYLERNKIDHSVLDIQLQKEDDTLKNLLGIIDKMKNSISKKVQDAEVLCPRIDNPRDRDVVESEIGKLKARIKSISKNTPNIEEISTLLEEKRKLSKDTDKTLNKLYTLTNKLKSSVDDHLRFTTSVEVLTFRRVNFYFSSILKLRDYLGNLNIDNDKRTLEIRCTGRDSAEIRKANTTSSLSGGERSYATVAFIMALWDCMDLPFYFLDEFDVFMDNVNRKITMDLLINHAEKRSNTQFVFLTPQDTSTIKASDTVKIHRLADPVRRQD